MEGYDIKKGWSTPFDNVGNESPDSNLPVQESQVPEIESVDAQAVTDGDVAVSQEAAKETSLPEVASYLNTASNALFAVDDLVTKGYLEKLGKMDVLDPGTLNEDDVVMFKIDLMTYEKDEYATDKFVSVFSAMTYTVNTVSCLGLASNRLLLLPKCHFTCPRSDAWVGASGECFLEVCGGDGHRPGASVCVHECICV